MKIFKIILLFILIVSFTEITSAWKWYDRERIDWTPKSWYTPCNWTKILQDNFAWTDAIRRKVWRYDPNNVYCYIPDNDKPVINIQANWYNLWSWTKNDVTLTFSANDNGSWLKSFKYSINWWAYVNGNGNGKTINFTEEWWYQIRLIAEDKANVNWANWTLNTNWNIQTKTIQVKIDKTAPFLKIPPVSKNLWSNNKWTINFQIKDTYKWEDTITKVFNCWIIPSNAYWIYPLDEQWFFEWTCEINDTNNCLNDSQFSPNTSICNNTKYKCNNWYTLGNDKNCHKNQEEFTCDNSILPQSTYMYNEKNQLVIEWSAVWKVEWYLPDWINYSWEFYADYVLASNNYSPSLNKCSFRCKEWYSEHNWDCVNDIKSICCDNPLLSETTSLWENSLDCNLVENQDQNECSKSSVCLWDKEVFWEWNKNNQEWDYSTDDWTYSWNEWLNRHCWYTIFENSETWHTCDAWYYLIRAQNNKPLLCETTEIWYWSDWNSNDKEDCTNKPSNSYYTSWWTNNNCEWSCDTWYSEKNGNSCIKNNWETTSWNSCNSSCWDWTQSRTVSCTNYQWYLLNDSDCLDDMPDDYQSCSSSISCQTENYNWDTSEWGSCDATCWKWNQTRTINCIRESDWVIVSEGLCDSNNKPEDTIKCTNPDNTQCSFTYKKYWYGNDSTCNDINSEEYYSSRQYSTIKECRDRIDSLISNNECKKRWRREIYYNRVLETWCN